MNTFSYQRLYPLSVPLPAQPPLDWLELEWGGPYNEDDEEEEDMPPARCGEWGCPGDCYICVACEQMLQRLWVPIQGPVNRDGISLGFLLLRG
jgi:hypothetical protein